MFCCFWFLIFFYKIGFVVVVIVLIFNVVSDIFMLLLLKFLFDDGFGKVNSLILKWMFLVVIGLMVVCGVIGFVFSYCILWVFGKVVMYICCCLFSYMMGMLVFFFD